MKKLSVVVCTLVWIVRGFFKTNHGNTHHRYDNVIHKRNEGYVIVSIHITVIHIRITYWRRNDWPFIYFLIFVSMDEKIECRSLYFLVSILRGIIFMVIVVLTHTHIILASRWLTIYLFCYFRTFVWRNWVS